MLKCNAGPCSGPNNAGGRAQEDPVGAAEEIAVWMVRIPLA